MTHIYKSLFSIALLTCTTPLSARDLVTSSSAKIIALHTFASGDTIIKTDIQPEGCESGFWIGDIDVGQKTIMAQIISAKVSSSTIHLQADKDIIWSGSNSNYCHIYSLGID
jgi:hypothetical protein